MRRFCAFAFALCALPSGARAYETETAAVPMRDGIHLNTEIVRPTKAGKYPTVLIRTPYGAGPIDGESAQVLCDTLGYVVISQDVRGQGDSEGVDDVFLSDGWGEHQDGYDTVEWIIHQGWSDGGVGMFGVSAMGVTSYMALGSLHPAIKTVHVGVAPWNFYNTVYPGGEFRNALVTDWLEGQGSAYMLDVYSQHQGYDDVWDNLDMRTRADQLTVPMFVWGGWHDVFTEGVTTAFSQMQAGGPVGQAGYIEMLMGPWTHIDAGAFDTRQGELTYPDDSVYPLGECNPIAWFGKYLQTKGRPTAKPSSTPVRFYIMGDVDATSGAGNQWALAKAWPLATDSRKYYLGEGGTLSQTAPVGFPTPVSYKHDPANPSPTIGGHELTLPAGPRDQRPLAQRADVKLFQTPVLDKAVTVVGDVRMQLFASSTAPDTDFTVRLADVYPDGRAMLVTDGVVRARYRNGATPQFLTPGQVTTFDIDLGPTAQTFAAGHRIQILVSSSNARRFLTNWNNTDDMFSSGPGTVATNSLYMDEVFASRLELPIPRTGAYRPEAPKNPPSTKAIQLAVRRMQRGQKLSVADRSLLELEGGRRLLEYGMANGVP